MKCFFSVVAGSAGSGIIKADRNSLQSKCATCLSMMSDNPNIHLTIRNTRPDDISKIILLQEVSCSPTWPNMVIYGTGKNWKATFVPLPQGQFVAVEPDGTVVGYASTLILSLTPEYAEHTWCKITADGLFTITILMETAYTEQIYPLIQNIDMRGLELFYME